MCTTAESTSKMTDVPISTITEESTDQTEHDTCCSPCSKRRVFYMTFQVQINNIKGVFRSQ